MNTRNMNTRNILIVWCVLHAVLALPTRVTAADYYVSASGNDSSAGTSTSPWRTIAKVNTVNLRASAWNANGTAYGRDVSLTMPG